MLPPNRDGTTAAYASGPADRPLLAETIGDALRRMAQARPDREAIVSVEEGLRLSYVELDERVDALARGLLAAGIETGDRVALCAPNCLEWVLIGHATARVGAILVALNPGYREAELEYALADSGSRLLFARAASPRYREMLEALGGRLDELERLVFLGELEGVAGCAVAPDALAERAQEFDFDALAIMQYTSGTTGVPTAPTLTHHSVLNNGYFAGLRMGYTADDRICVPVPLFHAFGTTFGTLAALSHGATMVLTGARFDPGGVLAAVAAERCTSVYGVPTTFLALLEHPERGSFDLGSLRTGLAAGAPCPPELMRRLAAVVPEIGIGYGMTETSPCSLQTSPGDVLERRLETVGTAHPHVEVKIADPQSGRCARRGERGEVCTRGYSVMAGYWRDPERTAEAIDARGWMHTGDLGVMDADGCVRIVGRIKDIVIRGGENIDVREVENLLRRHDAVAEACVMGLPDERLGEELVAWVRLRPGATLEANHLQAYTRQRLASFKVPRRVRFVTELPTTPAGEPHRRLVRERSIAELRSQ